MPIRTHELLSGFATEAGSVDLSEQLTADDHHRA